MRSTAEYTEKNNVNNNEDLLPQLEIMSSTIPDCDWTEEHEKILVEWADKAMCYRWLHAKANAMYSHLNAWYTIPVIIISTVTGTANFAQSRIQPEFQAYFAMVVGGFNIMAGIITTIQQFLKITQLNEAHRVSSIAWDKFYRNIKIELAKHPSERLHVIPMLKICKEEFDRLMETSPVIPDRIVYSFKTSFKQDQSFDIISKPEICDVLISTHTYKNPWSNDENKAKRVLDNMRLQMLKDDINSKTNITNIKTIDEFEKMFYNLHRREPLETEIIDNLKDKIELTILEKLVVDRRSKIQIQITDEIPP